MPWVREDSRKPPLRPLAAAPTRSASRILTSRPGSSDLACSAVQSPVKPPPTMQRSVSAPVSGGGSGGRAGSESVQKGAGFASA